MRRYGSWAGNPKGTPEGLARCIASVPDFSGFIFRQCSRKRGHGDGELFCKQHAKKLHVHVPSDEERAVHGSRTLNSGGEGE